MNERQLGFIGLGQMGGAMVGNLLRAGFPVTVYDVRTQLVEACAAEGATAARSCRQVAERAEVVLASLPDPAAVDAAVLGAQGVAEGIGPGAVFIDLSTIDPETSRRAHAAIAARGASMLDCPVGKGPPAAAAGELTLMVGGEPETVERVRDVLETLGSALHHCGPAGSGAAAKLVNNLVSCSLVALNAEAMVLAAKAGVDVDVMCEVMKGTAADSRHLRGTIERFALQGRFEPRFKLALADKDLRLACRLGLDLGVPTPLATAARLVHQAALAEGLGEEDQGACLKVLEKLAGMRARGA